MVPLERKVVGMVAEIGLMIGAYIIVRMISFLTRKGERAESVLVKIFAVITGLFTILILADLLMRGLTSTPPTG